jgi:peptide/nickel transport system permease protein
MRIYLFKRLLTFLPALLLLSLITFSISRCQPVSPVEKGCQQGDQPGRWAEYLDCVERKRSLYHLDRPAFYMTLRSLAAPDTLEQVFRPGHREALERLLARSGNWPRVEALHRSLLRLEAEAMRHPPFPGQLELIARVQNACREHRTAELRRYGASFRQPGPLPPRLSAAADSFDLALHRWEQEPQHWKKYIPVLRWHGWNNQYHHWLIDFLGGDPGRQMSDDRPLAPRLAPALARSASLGGISLLLIYLLGIPLGILSARFAGRWPDRLSSGFWLALDTLPAFMVAVLLVHLALEGILPLPYRYRPGNVTSMVLPVAALSVGGIAWLSRNLRAALLEVLPSDYIRSARAAGFSQRSLYFRWGLRNALSPAITLLALLLPSMAGGALVVEQIFDYDGMGLLLKEAASYNERYLLMALFGIGSLLTLSAYLAADLLIAYLYPTLRLQNAPEAPEI